MSKRSRLTPEQMEAMAERGRKRIPSLKELERQYAAGEISEIRYWSWKRIIDPTEENQIKAAEVIMAK